MVQKYTGVLACRTVQRHKGVPVHTILVRNVKECGGNGFHRDHMWIKLPYPLPVNIKNGDTLEFLISDRKRYTRRDGTHGQDFVYVENIKEVST